MAGYSSPAWVNGASPAINASNLLALSQAVELAQHPFGVCSTAAATKAKTVTIDYSGTLALFQGLTVVVKFSNSNTASAPTLNVNGTGAKLIKSYGTTAATTWVAGQIITFVYDGTNWLFDGIDAYTKAQSLSSSAATAIGNLTGGTPTTPSEAIANLTGYLGGVPQIQVLSYVGTGQYGSAHKNSVTFSFIPKLVFLFDPSGETTGPGDFNNVNNTSFLGPAVLLWGVTTTLHYGIAFDSTGVYASTVSYSSKTMTWYNRTSDAYQHNLNGFTYPVVALG